MESPLRKASFLVDVEGKAAFDDSQKSHGGAHPRADSALESETEDDEIHVDAPASRVSKYTGNGYDPPTEDLGPFGGNTDVGGGWIQETGYGVPILASDEVAKEPGLEYLQPAVSPAQERRGSTHYAGIDSEAPPSYQSGYRNQSRPGSASNSRPSSRPGSIHGSLPGQSRYALHDEREDMHTPLENVDEYEPLFPDDEDQEARPLSATEKFKRRESLKRRFPSQDIWEDTPNSLQLQATVETPEPTEEPDTSTTRETRERPGASANFESPEAEAKRKGEIDEAEKARLISKEQSWAKPHWKPHLREERDRPGLKQRFPSQDIWEDPPDSACLETTVEAPQSEEPRSSPIEGVTADEAFDTSERLDKGVDSEAAGDGSLPERTTVHKGGSSYTPLTSEISGKSKDASSQAIPNVPARPARRLHQVPPTNTTSYLPKTSTESVSTDPRQVSPSESRKAPIVPERPKPQIPARPPRSGLRDASETTPLSKTTSTSSISSAGAKEESQVVTSPPPPPKPKPALPSRPVGSKIASLKAGFLSDLDKRLQIGPQAPKAPEKAPAAGPETEGEKAPLTDARKGRARGPPRRKPGAPSVAAAAVEEEGQVKPNRSNWVIEEPWTVWQTEDDGSINALHAAHPSITPQKESGTDDAQSPPVPIHSSDSMSAGDTPTSSRDETVPTPDDPTSSDGFTTGAFRDQSKEGIPGQAQPLPEELHPGHGGTEIADQAGDDKAVRLNPVEDRERKSPVDVNVGEHEEGGVAVKAEE